MAGRLKALHHALALPGGLVGVLGTIIQVPALAMFHTREHLPLSSAVARQFVGDEDARHVGTALQELAEELEGRTFVPAALDEDIQDVPVLIDGPP